MKFGHRVTTGALLLALGGAAHAQSPFHGGYFGAGGGVSKVKQPADCSLPFQTTQNCDIEDKKTAWRVFFGYQVNPYLAFEAGYADLGKFTTSFTIPGIPTTVSSSFRPTIYGVDAIGTLPIGGGFGLLGRIGFFHWKLQAATTVSPFDLPGIVEAGGDTPKGYNVDFGVGAKWDFAQNLGVRLEYTRYPKIGEEETTGKADVDLLSASLLWRFQ